jgi:hypothetical protein
MKRLCQITKLVFEPTILAGLLVGAGAVLFVSLLGPIITGRQLGNPLPLAIAPGAMFRSITGGFRYFDWQSPLIHLLFAIGLGICAAFSNRALGVIRPDEGSAILSARIASGMNLAVASLAQVDALIVLIYFLIASFISITISAYAAARVARVWSKSKA